MDPFIEFYDATGLFPEHFTFYCALEEETNFWGSEKRALQHLIEATKYTTPVTSFHIMGTRRSVVWAAMLGQESHD